MSIATLCLAFACVLPILCAGLAKRSGVIDRTFDNHDPRGWLAKQSGAAARANAAQANSWEALIIFAAGVLTAQGASEASPAGLVDGLAIAFVVCRILYVAAYVGDKAALRSIVWTGGFAASLALFFVELV